MGKPKYIKTPEMMWDLFCAYRDEIKSNPIKIVEQKKGNTVIPRGATDKQIDKLAQTLVELPAQRPLTLEGFENYCADNNYIEDLGDYFSNNEGRYSDYATICKRIKKVIRQDQIEGGMAGIYNPSITQRLNNLVEKVQEDGKQEVTIKVKYDNKRDRDNS